MNKYYVYCFLDPTKPGKYTYDGLNMSFLYEPFYIGKGSGNRAIAHFYPSNLKVKNYKNSKIKNIISNGKKPIIEIIQNKINEINSYLIEGEYVSKIGRVDLKNGPLCNLTNGGHGAVNLQLPSKRIKVYQFDLNSNFIKEYESLTSASIINKLQISNIQKCCVGKANTHGGYHWSYKKENNNFIINKLNKKIHKFDLDGNLIKVYNSISEISKEIGIQSGTISRCCKGELIKLYNFYYRYDNNIFKLRNPIRTNRHVLKINDGYITIFKSVKEASEILNIAIKNVIHRCKNKHIHDEMYLIYKDDYINGISKCFKKAGHGEKKIYKKDINDTIVDIFESISGASKIENISRGYLSRLIKNNKIYKNCYYTNC